MGIMMNHNKDPYWTTSISWKDMDSLSFFVRGICGTSRCVAYIEMNCSLQQKMLQRYGYDIRVLSLKLTDRPLSQEIRPDSGIIMEQWWAS